MKPFESDYFVHGGSSSDCTDADRSPDSLALPASVASSQSAFAADVALIDIMMPDMDGYETIREIRSLPEFLDLPIVAVTAKAMKGDRQKCIQAGASDYVSKPVDIDHLISVLRVSIQRAERIRALRQAGENVVPLATTAV